MERQVPLNEMIDQLNWRAVPALTNGDLPGLPRGVVDGEDVVAVDPDGGHAVGGAADGDPVALVLLLDWRRNRIAVVSAESKQFLV